MNTCRSTFLGLISGYDQVMHSWSTLEKISFFQHVPMALIFTLIIILPGVSANEYMIILNDPNGYTNAEMTRKCLSNTKTETEFVHQLHVYTARWQMKDGINIAHNWYKIACKGDQYFDPHTGNYDPCAPLCAVRNCSHICPNYQIPRVSNILQPAGSIKSSTFTKDSLVLALAVLACVVLISALFGFILYRQYHQNKGWCKVNSQIPETTVAIQITEPDIENDERVPMNANTEDVFEVL